MHVIIATLFIENPENLSDVNHKNGVKLDCSVSNLEWLSRSDNMKHAFRTGLNKGSKGETNGNSRLDKSLVESVYLLAVNKTMSQEKIGEKFGIPQITVSNIKTKKTWSHVTDKLD